jgi:hypothetical protein
VGVHHSESVSLTVKVSGVQLSKCREYKSSGCFVSLNKLENDY